MGEEVTEAGEPEQAVGAGVVAERELEVGERAVRCGEGDAPAGSARHALAAPPALERAEESDGAQSEEAHPDGEGPDVVALPARGGVVSPCGLVDIVWAARGRAGVRQRRCAVNGRPRAARVVRVVGTDAVLWLLHGAVRVGTHRAMDDGRRRGCLGRGGGCGGCHRLGPGNVGCDSVRDDEGPARVDPVGVAERCATGLRYADVGRVDPLPVLAVAVVGGRDAPQGVTGHHGVVTGAGCAPTAGTVSAVSWATGATAATLTAELVMAGDAPTLARPAGTARSWPRTTTAVMTAETRAEVARWLPSRCDRFPRPAPRWVTTVAATETRSRPRPARPAMRRGGARTNRESGSAAPPRPGHRPGDGAGAASRSRWPGRRGSPPLRRPGQRTRRALLVGRVGGPWGRVKACVLVDMVNLRGDAAHVGGGLGHVDLEAADADDAEQLGRQSVGDVGVDGVALHPGGAGMAGGGHVALGRGDRRVGVERDGTGVQRA